MSSTKRKWALDPCPEEPPKRQIFPGHSKEVVKSPTKKLAPSRPRRGTPHRHARISSARSQVQSLPVSNATSEDPWTADISLPEPFTESLGNEDDLEKEREDGGLEEAYNEFVQLIDEQYIVFVQVTTFLYVVQGFDPEQRIGTGSYYHLEARCSGETDVRLSCLCPEGKRGDCLHKRYYRDFRDLRFRVNEEAVKTEGAVVLFLRQMIGTEDETWNNRFSVAYDSNSDAIRSRTVVAYEGLDSGGGKWSCAKCAGHSCGHIGKAKRLLSIIVGNTDGIIDMESGEQMDEVEMHEMYMVDSANTRSMDERAISYLPILPPEWASLPEDPQLYRRPSPGISLPSVLSLDETSRSACGKHFYNPASPIAERECTVYTLIGQQRHTILVQACPSCPAVQKCWIGPDLRVLGLFNLNNSVLFTHELLDDYTNRYTGSETPFAAFVVSMGRIYAGRKDKFVGEDLFRAAWFAFASLQNMTGDMSCPHCGEDPDTVIFDGVTTGFAKRHLRETLAPPTTLPSEPLIRLRTRHSGLQWLPGSSSKGLCTRDRLAGWVKKWCDKVLKESKEQKIRMEELLTLEKELKAMGASPVADALHAIYGAHTELQDLRMRRRYRVLFEQLSANESAIQMTNELGLESLKRFVEKPSVANASLLVDIPALMVVVEHSLRLSQHNEVIVRLCEWMMRRAEGVLSTLKQGEQENLETIRNSSGSSTSWKEIRTRPAYPKITGDSDPEKDIKRGGQCSKFYSTYGERRLTGGLLCAWCQHSICYGFHCIPKGEGRNDVFSALVTRWPKAPRRVIYDFACALGPYCMTREPEFFSRTHFLIDRFHAKGHTKCSSAAFLSTHGEVDGEVDKINSSAGECGNSGIGRIRKAVSYMRQNRAIIFIKHYVSVWNRMRIRKMRRL
ncbi:hypothetical protein VNI00_016771 [Paramarasmius palmivorus]|uniref:HMG domain-containing protein n=1 Tax=Paramarasmius palmivorus TaxID=297713 RepID=A0AAW0BCH6_9AGAR